MTIDAYFFDLDGTLYDEACGLLEQVNQKINEWILLTVPMPEEEVPSFRDKLFEKYGGTLYGLAEEYGSDIYASMRFCHDLPVEKYISPNPKLRESILSLQGRKYIFTSSYRFYATKVLKCLGILDCFDGIIDALDVYPTPKPSPRAYQTALRIAAEPDVHRCAFIDDQRRNVEAAYQAGFFAVQAGRQLHTELADAFLWNIEDIVKIPQFTKKGNNDL